MTEPASPADDAVPTLWPAELDADYTLVGEQGRGGMAVVFRARDKSLGRDVAVKVVRPRFAADEEAVSRLAREARTVAQLEHPNIVGVYSIRHLGDGSVALVMQLIPGRTLKQAVTQDGPFSPERTEQVLRDVGRALAYAHRAGVVHRDVKPENIFLDDVSGRAMLSDFGVARVMDAPTELTATGTTIGTPTYMAPEQIDGISLDGRSDLYSLGMVGWELLTGERPWTGESLYSVIYRQKHDPLPPIDAYREDVPLRLQYLVEGLMPKDPDRRLASAARFLTLLASEQALPGFREWESAQRRRRRTRVFREARERGDSMIGAAIETVKFSRPATPASGSVAATPRSAPAVKVPDEPIAGEQPGVFPPPPDESALKLTAPPRTTPSAVPSMRPPRRTPSTPLTMADIPGAPGVPRRRPVAPPHPRGSRWTRAVLAIALVAAGGAYWWFEYGPGGEEPVRMIGFSTLPQDRAGIELPVVAQADSGALATSDSTPVAAFDAPTQPTTDADTANPAALRPDQDSARLAATPPPARDRGVTTTPAGSVTVPATAPQRTPELPVVIAPITPAAPVLNFPQNRGNIAAGGRHSCLLDNDGRAACWGNNEDGQLGDGTYDMRPAPVRVVGDFVFSQVTAGSSHSCGLTVTNEVFCWGGNAGGQLGDGTTSARTAPVRLNSPVSFRLVQAGRAHTCGLSNSGTVFCWGANSDGQIGDGSRQGRSSPVMVELPAAASGLSVGSNHACALTVDGRAFCWGRNDYGQVGDGTTTSRAAPTKVETSAQLVSIASGASHGCAVASNGRAVCWGRSNYGQAGVPGTGGTVAGPRELPGPSSFLTIVAGGVHTCARARDGTAWCWGRNSYGQLGDGSTTDKSAPVQVRGVSRLVSLNAGAAHTCATAASGEAWCWGYNIDGQVGRGDRENAFTPSRLTPPR
jgi:serine/threonine protein kinase/alpha-tubulin suppressor-like RCC1 family protein